MRPHLLLAALLAALTLSCSESEPAPPPEPAYEPPLDANVLFVTVMANRMPFVGRG